MKTISQYVPANIYLLSEAARALTWSQWKEMGGCGLSGISEGMVSQKLGLLPKPRRYGRDPMSAEPRQAHTLGEIQDAFVVAGREIARFAIQHLGKPGWAIIEYEDGKRLLPEMPD